MFGGMILFNHSAANMVSRWTHEYKNGAATQVQLYYDRYRRNEESLDSRQTADFDLQHTFAQRGAHTVQAGLGYRHTWDYLPPSAWVRFNQISRSDYLGSGFLQDEIALGDSRWKLLLGTRFERNNYTGFEIQPGARLNYEWTPTRSVWGAISRSVRTPSRFEHDVNYVVAVQPVAPGLNAIASVTGNPNFKAEETQSYSVGYREQLSNRTSIDATGFYNHLTGLRGVEQAEPFPSLFGSRPVFFQPFNVRNAVNGSSYGSEVTVRRQIHPIWQLSGSYSFLGFDLRSSSMSTVTPEASYNAPTHSAVLDSRFDVGHGWQVDLFAYGQSRFTGPIGNAFYRPIAGRVRTDVRIGKKLPGGFDLSVIGQNLTNPRRIEGIPEANEIGTYQRRSVLVRLEYRFNPKQ
jgi:iron complex outermembrane receptor protein